MPEARRHGRQKYVRSLQMGELKHRVHILTGIKRQERAKAQQPKGKLGRDLAKERAQTRVGTLENISQDERKRREADKTSQAINYN